jgi:hypothetical protein
VLVNVPYDAQGDLEVDVVRLDDRCLLGLWLHASGNQAVRNPTALRMLRDVHAEFHRAASEVLSLAVTGRTKEATLAMAEDTQYASWSAMLVVALKGYAGAVSDDPNGPIPTLHEPSIQALRDVRDD